jgi:parallel beta-helix repeat protein
MTKLRVVLMALLFLAIIAVTLGVAAEEKIARDPISIRSDADLCAENGIVSGTGLTSDPYVISGWTINVQYGIGIRIQGTSAHILIRDCRVIGNHRHGTGILLQESRHIRVENCLLTDLETGIFIYQSAGAIVDGNTFTLCIRGIEGTESDGITVARNGVDGAIEYGIFLWRCHNASLSDNTAAKCRNGIYLDSCHRDNLERNYVEDMDRGIFLWDCFDCTITGNTIRTCDLGLAVVHTSERNTIFHNAFLDNTRPATCDEAGNRWDDGYPTGGNFWGEEDVVDQFCGIHQGQPGADGISDIIREIPFGNVDRYPLVSPPKTDEAS